MKQRKEARTKASEFQRMSALDWHIRRDELSLHHVIGKGAVGTVAAPLRLPFLISPRSLLAQPVSLPLPNVQQTAGCEWCAQLASGVRQPLTETALPLPSLPTAPFAFPPPPPRTGLPRDFPQDGGRHQAGHSLRRKGAHRGPQRSYRYEVGPAGLRRGR